MDGITDSMDMSFSKLREMVKDRKPGVLQSMGLQRVGHDFATEQLTTTTLIRFVMGCFEPNSSAVSSIRTGTVSLTHCYIQLPYLSVVLKK